MHGPSVLSAQLFVERCERGRLWVVAVDVHLAPNEFDTSRQPDRLSEAGDRMRARFASTELSDRVARLAERLDWRTRCQPFRAGQEARTHPAGPSLNNPGKRLA